jgi:hypothetical protein
VHAGFRAGRCAEVPAERRVPKIDAELRNGRIANDWIIVYAQNGDLIGYLNFGFNAGVDDVRRNAVVATENAKRKAQRPDRLDDPSPTQSPVDVAAEAGAPASVDR